MAPLCTMPWRGGLVALAACVAVAIAAAPPGGERSEAAAALPGDDECAAAGAPEACALGMLQRKSLARQLFASAAEEVTAGSESEHFVGSDTITGHIRWANFPTKCLDVRDGRAKNGNRLQVWDCIETSKSQLFRWSSSDKRLRWAAHPNFCVDVHDKKNRDGTYLQLWECGDGQTFEVGPKGEGKIAWSGHPDKCVDVHDHSGSNGNTFQIWTCQAQNTDQIFIFGAQSGGSPTTEPLSRAAEDTIIGHIRWANFPTKCLDVRDGLAENGNRLQVWDCIETSKSQLFRWSSSDKRLRWAAHPNFCVDVHDKKNRDGTYLQLWECGDGQTFEVGPKGEGKIAWSGHPDKCVDVRDHSGSNGNTFQIWTCQAQNTDQIFIFGAQSGGSPTTQTGEESDGVGGEAYDVVVIGGGLVGSVVAAELAEKLPGRRVVLVEAGRASQAAVGGKDPPAAWDSGAKAWREWQGLSKLGLTKYDVPGNYEALQCWRNDCPESWGHAVPAFQCKVLGGCGVMNGALMQIPADAMFDAWPAGWHAVDMHPHFSAAQSMLKITQTPSEDEKHYLDKAGASFFQQAFTLAGYELGDTLRPRPQLMGEPEVSARGGVRQSTTSEMLPKAMALSNFELMLETEALEIVHSGGTASSVLVRRVGQAAKTLKLKRGGVVVVSSGALNTPRLLLASGVTGEGSVGKGVSDHTLMSMVYLVSPGTDVSALSGASESFSLQPPSAEVIAEYVASRSGPLAQYGPTIIAFIRHPTTEGPPEAIDVEVWVNPVTRANELHVSIVLMRPTCSNANMHLEGDRLRQSGSTALGCGRDREIMDFAAAEIDKWLGKLGARRADKRRPDPLAMNHWVGSCRLGACASPASLRVRGTTNIAVADASLVPEQVWGHPALTLTAVGFKAAQVLAASLA